MCTQVLSQSHFLCSRTTIKKEHYRLTERTMTENMHNFHKIFLTNTCVKPSKSIADGTQPNNVASKESSWASSIFVERKEEFYIFLWNMLTLSLKTYIHNLKSFKAISSCLFTRKEEGGYEEKNTSSLLRINKGKPFTTQVH